MDKNELKKIIKPLIKECLKEVLLEEGLKTFTNKETITENIELKEKPIEKTQVKTKIDYNKIFKKDIIEKNKKLGFDLSTKEFNPFQGTLPADVLEKIPTPQQKQVSNLINESSGEWSRILDAVKARK